jgi:hypothetical protein
MMPSAPRVCVDLAHGHPWARLQHAIRSGSACQSQLAWLGFCSSSPVLLASSAQPSCRAHSMSSPPRARAPLPAGMLKHAASSGQLGPATPFTNEEPAAGLGAASPPPPPLSAPPGAAAAALDAGDGVGTPKMMAWATVAAKAKQPPPPPRLVVPAAGGRQAAWAHLPAWHEAGGRWCSAGPAPWVSYSLSLASPLQAGRSSPGRAAPHPTAKELRPRPTATPPLAAAAVAAAAAWRWRAWRRGCGQRWRG